MMDDRLTRCPNCTTCFTISDHQLNQAYGAVRCGRCKKIFNAAHHLMPEAQNASPVTGQAQSRPETAQQQPKAENLPPQKHEAESDPYTESAYPEAPEAATPASDRTDAVATDSTDLSSENQPTASATEQAPERPDEADTDLQTLLQQQPDTPELQLDAEELKAIREARRDKGNRPHQMETLLKADRDEAPPKLKESVHLFAETRENPPPPKADTTTQNSRAPLLAMALAAGLLATLLLLAWANTRTLSQTPGLTDFAEALCQLTPCDHLLPSDFSGLESRQRELITDNGQHQASLILVNPTELPLPFPALLLEFYDASGKVVAEALHQPEQYLDGKPFADGILPIQLPVPLTLPVSHDASPEQTFSVRFLPTTDH